MDCCSKATFLIPLKTNSIHRILYYQPEVAPLLFWGYSITSYMMLVLKRSETLCLFLFKVCLPFSHFFNSFLSVTICSAHVSVICGILYRNYDESQLPIAVVVFSRAASLNQLWVTFELKGTSTRVLTK